MLCSEKFKKNIKIFLKKILPIFLIRIILRIIYFIKFNFYYKIIFHITALRNKKIDLFKIYWIDPEIVDYCCKKRFRHLKDRGLFLEGDWDFSDKKFDDWNRYKSFKEHFVQNKKWEDTDYYKEDIKKINSGQIIKGCRNKEEFNQRLKKIDDLFFDIKNNGYLLGGEKKRVYFHRNFENDRNYQKMDEILVSIGRNGDFLFSNGFHRFSIAKILKIKKIPVMIATRHKKWIKFKNELITYARLQGGKLYQPAYHPDLEDIPFELGNERINIIRKNTSIQSGNVLDIGAYFGYHSHILESFGFECYAVENNLHRLYFMKKLKRANKDNFKIISESIFKYEDGKPLNFNIVLALNIFHHFIKTEETFNELKGFLGRLKCREMFFESHYENENQMKDAFRNFSSEEFVNFIIQHSCLNNFKLLREFKNGRKLYKLYV